MLLLNFNWTVSAVTAKNLVPGTLSLVEEKSLEVSTQAIVKRVTEVAVTSSVVEEIETTEAAESDKKQLMLRVASGSSVLRYGLAALVLQVPFFVALFTL